MSDKVHAARVAWALIKLSQLGTHPVHLGQLAGRVGLAADEALRLLRLTWREKVAVRDGEIHLDATPDGPRRYRVDADGHAVGSGRGCSVDMYLLALALGKPIHTEATCPATGEPITIDITPERVERIDPPTAVVAITNLDFDITGGPDNTDAELCSQQPFFASAQGRHGVGGHAPGRAPHPGAGLPRRGPPPGRLAGSHPDVARRHITVMGGHMTTQTRATDLEEFDQGWLTAMEQTPFVKAIIALSGLTRLGGRPASLSRLAAIIDRPLDEAAALVRREFVAHIEDGLIYWDDPYPGDRTRRMVYIGDRAVPMGSGCGPDVFTFAAVFDVPFRVEETCPATGTPIRVVFVPGGVERVDPPEAVTVLLHPKDFGDSVGGHFDEINANVCTYQPFFASAEAAEPALAARPGSRAFTVQEMFERPWFTYYRDTIRPLIHSRAT